MADLWLNDPTLFLYYQGRDEDSVPYIWRCNKITSPLPLQRSDFTVRRTQVVGPQSLVGRHVRWSRGNYDGLIDYISSRRLLVNREGLVFEEIYKVEEDGSVNVMEHIYVRWLEVLNMEAYGFTSQDVCYKNAEYLGKASSPLAVCSPPPPRPNDGDESVVVKKLIADLAALTSKFAGLEVEKTKLRTDLAKVTTEVATLTKDLNYEKNERDDLKITLAGLQVKMDEIFKESQPPATPTQPPSTPEWMNDFGSGNNDWVGIDDPTVTIYGLAERSWDIRSTPAMVVATDVENSCNVRASHMFNAVYKTPIEWYRYILIKVDNLTNNEMLRYRKDAWGMGEIGGVGRVLYTKNPLKSI